VRALAALIPAGLGLAVAMALSMPAQGQGKQLVQANAALQAGEADKALALLNTLAQPGGRAEAYNLRCRVEYSLEHWDQAANDCEQAVKLDAQNSGDHLWLGRALGEKASRASFLNAYSLAKRTRVEFEEAVRLNPRNVDALASLCEFYYTAPGVLGGGIDKSETVAAQLEKIDPARAHELRGNIAEHRKDYGTAEREFKQAIATAAHPAMHWTTLASFYRRRQRWRFWRSGNEQSLACAPSSLPDPAAELERRQAVAFFYRALDQLPEKYRTVLVLYEIEGLSTQSIADLCELNLSTVKVQLARARERFLNHFRDLRKKEKS